MSTPASASTTDPRDIAGIIERLDGAGFEVMVDELLHAARAAGDRVLMTEGKRSLTGNELAHAFEVLPAALAARGMRPGQVVLFGVRPGIDALLLLLAAMRTGAVVTFVDPGVGAELFERRLELLTPDWVIAESLLYVASAPTPLRGYLRRRGLTLPRLAKLPGEHVHVGRRLPGVPRRSVSLDQLLVAPTEAAGGTALPELDVDAPSLVIFTSGTTGEPKGVQHSGRSMAAAVRLFLTHFDLPPESVMYNHNIHSFVMAILAQVPTVVEPMEFRVDRFLGDCEAHGVTHTFGLPVDAYAMVQACERTGRRLPPSLRQMVLYSAPVTTSVLERIHAVAHPELRITCAYAMTEAAPVAWIDSRDKCAWEGEGDVVGPIAPEVEWRIDPDTHELLIKGDNVHRGYANIHPERIEWHATGDLARMDDDGNLVLMGRAKDMLIRGDFNLYPGLYEETISRIPGVGACAIVGRPDPVTADEEVILFLEPDPRADRDDERLARDVRRALEGGGDFGIDRKALPDEVRVLDALPRSGRSSKIDRRALRELARG